MPSQCSGFVSNQLDAPHKRRAPSPPSTGRVHAVHSGGRGIDLHRPHIGYGHFSKHVRLIVHVTSDLSRHLSGVSDIESPEFPVYSVQKQR